MSDELPRPGEHEQPSGDKPTPARIEPLPLDLADEDCPRCHAPLAHEAVMCVKCGYDLKSNVVHEPEVGETVAEPAAPGALGASKEFVTRGRGSAQVIATSGVFITLAALIIAGIGAREWGTWVVLGTVALTLYSIALHTCTGVLAVIVAARLCEEKFGNLELAAARMYVAVGLFYATSRLSLPIPWPFVSSLIIWVAALGLYYALLWFLFKKDRYGTALIALSHFVLWLLLEAGASLAAWVASGKTPVAAPGA